MQWLNTLLSAAWPSALEVVASKLFSENLQEALDKARVPHGETLTFAPYPDSRDARNTRQSMQRRKVKFLESATVHELTLGSAAPVVYLRGSRYDPEEHYLQLECDLAFDTTGFQALIDTVVRPVPLLPALRCPVALHDLSLHGRLLLGFALCAEAPGVARMEASFVEAPVLDVRVSALGLPLTDVPGVEAWATRSLARVLATNFVEPKRARVNTCRQFAKQTLGKQAGSGGTLLVAVMGASTLQAPHALVAPSAYVECRYAGGVRRTHVAPCMAAPLWGCLITFPVPASAVDDSHPLQLCVTDWAEVGEPAVVGEASVVVHWKAACVAVGDPLHTYVLPLRRGETDATLTIQMGVLRPGDEHYALALAAEVATARDTAIAQRDGSPPSLVPRHPLVAVLGNTAAPAPPGEGEMEAMEVVHGGGGHVGDGPSPEGDDASHYDGESVYGGPGGSVYSGRHDVRTSAGSLGDGSRHSGPGRRPGTARVVSQQARQAVTDILTTLAQGGTAATAIAQAARAATAMVATAQNTGASAHSGLNGGDDMDAGGSAASGGMELSVVGPPQQQQGPLDRLIGAGVRALDAAATAAASNASAEEQVGGPQPGRGQQQHHHSRSTSWDDIGLPPPGRHRAPPPLLHDAPGHRRSVSAGSSGDGRLDFSLEELSAGEGPVHATQQLIQDLQRRVAEEREARAQAVQRIRELEAAAAAAEQLRHAEDMRALVEGARFVMHTLKGTKTRFLWLHASRKCLCWAPAQDKKFDPAVEKAHFVPLAVIDRCELGSALFDAMVQSPGGAGGGGTPGAAWRMGGGKLGALPRDERSALSIVVKATPKDAVDAGSSKPFPLALHLELPPGGNGRSGREWVSAFNAVVRATKEPVRGLSAGPTRQLALAPPGEAALLNGLGAALRPALPGTAGGGASQVGGKPSVGPLSPGPPNQTPAARLAAAAALALWNGTAGMRAGAQPARHQHQHSHSGLETPTRHDIARSPSPSARRSPSPMGHHHHHPPHTGNGHPRAMHGRGQTVDFGQMAAAERSKFDGDDGAAMRPRSLALDDVTGDDHGGPARSD